MKKHFTLISALLLILFSCQKDFLGNEEVAKETDFSVNTLRSHYETLKKKNSLPTVSSNAKLFFLPFWPSTREGKSNGLKYFEVALISYSKKVVLYNFAGDSLKIAPDEIVAKATFQRIIFFKENAEIKQHIVTYIPDKSYLLSHKFDASHNRFGRFDSDFSGYLEYSDLKGNITKIERIKNGKVGRTYRLNPINVSKLSKNTPITTKEIVCIQINCFTIYFMNCVPDPSYDHPYATICTETTSTSCDTYCYDDSGAGSNPCPTCPTGTTSSGGSSVQDPSPGNPNGPCGKLGEVTGNLNNPTILSLNNDIRTLSHTNEYGVEYNWTSLGGNAPFMNLPVRTDGQPSDFGTIPSWNGTDGFTIGAAHGHPGGSAPSPNDGLWIYNTSINPNISSAPANELQGFKDHAFFVTNTANSTYVITIRDWGNYIEKANNGTISVANYQYYADDYDLITGSQATDQERGEYALLKLFGDSINLYVGGTGQSTYTAKTINTTNDLVTDINCL